MFARIMLVEVLLSRTLSSKIWASLSRCSSLSIEILSLNRVIIPPLAPELAVNECLPFHLKFKEL